MPPVFFGSHLLGYLYEFGPTMDGQPASFREIASWAELTGRRLDRWEALTLRKMSEAYAVQYQRSKEADCPSPLEDGQDTREETGNKIVDRFKALNSSRQKGRGRRV